MNQQAGVNNCYITTPLGGPTTNPYQQPYTIPYNAPSPGSAGYTDHNAALAFAVNRLAAALEKFNER